MKVFFGIVVLILGVIVGLFVNTKSLLTNIHIPYFTAKTTLAPTPTPTPDPTANWQRHTFPKMGFSLALPPKWYPHEEKSDIGGGGYGSWISYPVDNPSPQAPIVKGLVANIAVSIFERSNSLDQDATIRLTQPGHIEPLPEKIDSTLDGEKSIILKSPKVIQVIADHNGKRFLLQLGTDDPNLAQVFDQILSTFKFVDQYTCPVNGWVDCMPGTTVKPECSAAAMTWYKTNCPNFKGGAL